MKRMVATFDVPDDYDKHDIADLLPGAFREHSDLDPTVWEWSEFWADAQDGVVGPDGDTTTSEGAQAPNSKGGNMDRTFTATVRLRGYDANVESSELLNHINSALVDAAERSDDPDPWAGFVDVETLIEDA